MKIYGVVGKCIEVGYQLGVFLEFGGGYSIDYFFQVLYIAMFSYINYFIQVRVIKFCVCNNV